MYDHSVAIAFTFKGRAILGLMSIELSYNHLVESEQQNTIKPLNTPKQLSFECSQAGMSLKDVKQTKETVLSVTSRLRDFVIQLKIQLPDEDNFL